MRFVPAAAIAALFLAGCSSYVQTTSGADYLARSEALTPSIADDENFRNAASLEPLLAFPARIGIARVEDGRLVDIPAAELGAWDEALTPLKDDIGEFAPINLFVADLVAPERGYGAFDRAHLRRKAIEKIRLAGARQHLDAVLVYETHAVSEKRNTELALADITLIGAYLAPGRRIEAVGAASALLFDVRNNYPYASATVSVDKKDRAAAFSSRAKARDLEEDARLSATLKLASEIATDVFPKLKAELDGEAR